MRWRCAPGSALRERAGPDAEVTSGDIVLRSAFGVALKVCGVFRNANIVVACTRHCAWQTVHKDEAAGLYVAAREGILPPCAETETSILIEEDLTWNPIPR